MQTNSHDAQAVGATVGATDGRPDVPWRLGWGPRWLDRTLVALIAAGVVAWIVVGPLTKTPRHIDEGIHAVGARFFLLDAQEQVVRPNYYVGAWPEWHEGAYALLTFPPAPDVVYGTSIGLFGLNSMGFGLPLLLAGLLTAFALYVLGRRTWDHTTGLAAAAVFLWSAAGIREGSQFEAEPLVAALGTLAVALVGEGTARRRWLWFAIAGACFGGAFLMKLYMGLFPGVVALTFLVRGLREDRVVPVLGRWVVLGLATVAVGAAHLTYVAITSPADLPVWEFAYIKAIVERAGVAGNTPIWYYPGVLYRDFAALAIPFLWASVELVRGFPRYDVDERTRRWLYATTVLGIAALFVFSKKESAYLFPLVPFITLLAGRGLVGLARFAIAPPWRPRALLFGAALSLAAVIAVLVLWEAGFRTTGFDRLFVTLHTVALVLLSAALVLWRFVPRHRPARFAAGVLAGVAVAWGAMTAAQVIRDHRAEPLFAVARAMRAEDPEADGSAAVHSTDARPSGVGDPAPTFVSTRWQPLSALLWQRGRPWYWNSDRHRPWSDQVLRLEPSVRLFHIDREFRSCDGCPPTAEVHAAILDWLRHNAEDVTHEVESAADRPLRTYVFRRRLPSPRGSGERRPARAHVGAGYTGESRGGSD